MILAIHDTPSECACTDSHATSRHAQLCAAHAGAFFANWLSVILAMFVAQSLGLLIGATITHMQTALSVSTVLVLTIMLVSEEHLDCFFW